MATIDEGGVARGAVRLATRPSANVSIDLVVYDQFSLDSGLYYSPFNIAPSSMLFNEHTWSIE